MAISAQVNIAANLQQLHQYVLLQKTADYLDKAEFFQKDCIKILNIRSHGTTSRQTFLSRVSACIETNDLTIDLINSSQQTLSVVLHAPNRLFLEHCVSDLQELGVVTLMDNLAIISVIGHKMRNVVGIGAEIFSALAGAKINIYLISQGASEINIS